MNPVSAPAQGSAPMNPVSAPLDQDDFIRERLDKIEEDKRITLGQIDEAERRNLLPLFKRQNRTNIW
jgi:hypothetical protein